MRLDCNTREFEYFPFNPQGYRLVLLNSCVKHELAGSPYNDRRKSCENVAKAVQKRHPERVIDTLRDCTWDDLQEVKADVSAEDIQRATFVLGEKDRVLAVCDALVKGDYEEVGKQMYLTHQGLSKDYEVSCEELDFLNQGLSKDYEVSCEELDFLNDIAKANGVTGSRIMGGGFGGCTINLVKDELYDTFIADAKKKFAEKYGHEPKVIDVVIGDGSRKIC